MLAPLAAAFRVDRAGLRPVTAARATAGVVLPLVAGIAAGYPAAGATAAFGALSVGIPLVTSGPRTPVGTMLATSAGMALATFIGAVSGLVPPVHLIVLAAAGFGAGLLVAAGRGATQVGVNATIALLVFGRLASGPGTAAVHAAWVLAGGIIQLGLGIAARSQRPLRSQRGALAAAYDALAAAAEDGHLPITVAEAAAVAREAIGPWLQAPDRPLAGPLRGLADELDRMRHEFHALRFQQAQLPPEQRALSRAALAHAAVALREIGAGLREGRPPSGVEPVATQLTALADQLGPGTGANVDHAATATVATATVATTTVATTTDATTPDATIADAQSASALAAGARFGSARIAALAGQLRAVDRMATELAGVRRISLPISAANAADAVIVLPSGLRSVLRRVRAAMSPSSPAFRHAVRLAVVIPLATLISTYLPWQRGYWLPVTAVIVLKPDFATTMSRGVARTIGTGVGVLAGAAIVAFTHPGGLALIILIAICTWCGYTVFAASYAIYAIFLTAFVILLISAGENSAVVTVENRGFDTLIGGALAILAYLVWPTWEAGTLQAATADRFEAIRLYLGAVLSGYLNPESCDTATLERLAGASRRAQSSVVASLDRARGEPVTARPDIARYAGILTAGRRIVAGTHALASHLRDARRQVPVPAAAAIAAELDQAMSALVTAIRTQSPPDVHDVPDLRRSQRRLAATAASGQTPADRRGAILAELLDPLVDSIDSAADLLGGGQPAEPADAAGTGAEPASPTR